jgi:hypothetical protein
MVEVDTTEDLAESSFGRLDAKRPFVHPGRRFEKFQRQIAYHKHQQTIVNDPRFRRVDNILDLMKDFRVMDDDCRVRRDALPKRFPEQNGPVDLLQQTEM